MSPSGRACSGGGKGATSAGAGTSVPGFGGGRPRERSRRGRLLGVDLFGGPGDVFDAGNLYFLVMKDFTVQLADEVRRDLEEIGRRERRAPEDVARDMLERGVRAVQFRELRRESLESLGDEAPETDRQAIDEAT